MALLYLIYAQSAKNGSLNIIRISFLLLSNLPAWKKKRYYAIIRGKHKKPVERIPHKLGDIARRTALSFFLFSAVLAALLALSWFLLVPELTQVSVGGQMRNVAQLKVYKKEIERDIEELEQKRTAFLLPRHHELYTRIKSMKNEREQFQDLRRELNRVIKELIPNRNDVVIISDFEFDALTRTAKITGDIRNSGPRSMTVLARFVEDVQNINFVVDVKSSRFTRKQDPNIGFYSPFTLHVLLDRRV